MDDYAGRILAGRYRLPRPPADEFDLVETRAFDTYSGQEVLVRQLLLPEVVDAEFDDRPGGLNGNGNDDEGGLGADASARRALQAARAAAAIPDHPCLVQVFDVFTEGGSLWVVSELVPARPVAALIADRPLGPYRAAEIAADVLGGLRALHVLGWAHRNITARTVLVCDDGRAMLDGLALGAAQEALCGYDPVPQVPQEVPQEVPAATQSGAADAVPERPAWAGADSALALERARQARITVVGPVTERWSPEQASPVHDRGPTRLPPPPFQGSASRPSPAPTVGPATDLWALGSLLYRCVQGHPPFPEESAAELVQLVCAEPPAFAEECGPLRPVVESLLRQDPAERPESEELRGWLRSLVRSAPEPEIGSHTVQVPTGDPHKLPVVRRRGELVRLRRRRKPQLPRGPQALQPPAAPQADLRTHPPVHGRHARSGRRSPRRLGVWLVGLILIALLAFLVYAVTFMPRTNGGTANAQAPSTPQTPATRTPSASQNTPTPSDQSVNQTPDVGPDFTVRQDPAGFSVAVRNGWTRSVRGNEVIFSSGGGDFQLIVALGEGAGTDPMAYQVGDEPQLADYRASNWGSSSGTQRLTTPNGPAAEGYFTWSRQGSGSQLTAGNLVTARGGGFDVVFMTGPADQRTDIARDFAAAAQTFRAGAGR